MWTGSNHWEKHLLSEKKEERVRIYGKHFLFSDAVILPSEAFLSFSPFLWATQLLHTAGSGAEKEEGLHTVETKEKVLIVKDQRLQYGSVF